MAENETNVRVIKAEKKEPLTTRSRSELTLLWELIQRNPERAREFLERLRRSMKAA